MPEKPKGDTWDEYARLVLHQLEDHSTTLAELGRKIDGLVSDQKVDTRDRDIYRENIKLKHEKYERTLYDETVGLTRRVDALEQGDAVEAAVKKYRKYIVMVVFTVIFSVLIPLIQFVQNIAGA